MEGGELIGELVKILGGAGIGGGIMYLWIKNLLIENKTLKEDLKESQDSRVEELKNILPLLTAASTGLQEVISDNKDRDITLIKTILKGFNEAVQKIINNTKNGS